MRRREFIILFGGSAAVWPIAAHAQQPSRIWRIGYLSPTGESGFSARHIRAFVQKMQELGYVAGRNLILDVRRADGDLARLPGLADELVSLRPDVIVAIAQHAIAATQKATSSIPIVMLLVTDPVGSGFVESLAKPGGNITGFSTMLLDLSAKSLELLLLVVPRAKRVGVLMANSPTDAARVQEIHGAARTLGLRIVPVTATATGGADLGDAFEKFWAEKCDGLIVLSDSRVAHYRRIVDLAAERRLPAIYQVSELVRMGGLFSYSVDFVENFRSGAVYVDRILKGAAPAELPVEQPTKFELLVNLKTAKELGITIPDSLLVRADEVIE